jgi:hypothetical protein
VAAELGIADLLCSGPRGVDDLAGATSTDAPTLYRLLRALAAIGVFTELADPRRRAGGPPGARGILFDQPQVLAHAGVVLRNSGVDDRATVVPGDFFAGVPSGADAYLLVRILHDWTDQDVLRILRNVRAAMTTEARLLVVDSVVGPPNEDPLGKFPDLMMLVSAGGRERTEDEWRALLAESDLEFVAATRATPAKHVIEAGPTPPTRPGAVRR